MAAKPSEGGLESSLKGSSKAPWCKTRHLINGARIRRTTLPTSGFGFGAQLLARLSLLETRRACFVGQNAVISPGCVLSGWTRVGRDSFLGSGVLTYPKVQIGDSCVVSAGVVVSRNLRAGHKLILKPNTMTLPPD